MLFNHLGWWISIPKTCAPVQMVAEDQNGRFDVQTFSSIFLVCNACIVEDCRDINLLRLILLPPCLNYLGGELSKHRTQSHHLCHEVHFTLSRYSYHGSRGLCCRSTCRRRGTFQICPCVHFQKLIFGSQVYYGFSNVIQVRYTPSVSIKIILLISKFEIERTSCVESAHIISSQSIKPDNNSLFFYSFNILLCTPGTTPNTETLPACMP